MALSGDLPVWVVVLLASLVAAILLIQNIGWLLSARAMLDSWRTRPRPTPGSAGPAIAAEPKDVEP